MTLLLGSRLYPHPQTQGTKTMMPDEGMVYLARLSKAVADLKALAWDLIEMEFAPDTPDGSVHRERYRTIRKRVNDIADGCYGIGPEPAGDVSVTYGPVVAGPELAAEMTACVHCGGSGVKCCEFGADR